jgi:hypothetical protein
MKDMDRYFKALATAFVLTLGLLLWIGAIASIICSCASHKERVSIHTSDSISIVQEHTAQSSSFESMILRNFTIDSIIFSERLLIPDSATSETAHGSERTLIIRGFRGGTIENKKQIEERQSEREALKQHHEKDSTSQNSDTRTAGAALTQFSTTDLILLVIVLIIMFLSKELYYKCKK